MHKNEGPEGPSFCACAWLLVAEHARKHIAKLGGLFVID